MNTRTGVNYNWCLVDLFRKDIALIVGTAKLDIYNKGECMRRDELKGRIDMPKKLQEQLRKKSKDVSVGYMNKLAAEYIAHGLKYDKEHGTTCYKTTKERVSTCIKR